MSRTTKEEAKTVITDLNVVQSRLEDAEYTAKSYVKDPVLATKIHDLKLKTGEVQKYLNDKLNEGKPA